MLRSPRVLYVDLIERTSNTQNITTMSRYNPEWTLPVAFPPVSMDNVLAEWLGKQGVKQMHIAGTIVVGNVS